MPLCTERIPREYIVRQEHLHAKLEFLRGLMADTCDVGRYEQGVWLLRSAVVLVLALWVETVIGRDVKKPKPLPEAELVHMAPARVEPSDANSEAVDEVPPVSDPRRGRALTDMRNALRAARDDERPRLRTGTPLRRAPPNSPQKLPSRSADTMRRLCSKRPQ